MPVWAQPDESGPGPGLGRAVGREGGRWSAHEGLVDGVVDMELQLHVVAVGEVAVAGLLEDWVGGAGVGAEGVDVGDGGRAVGARREQVQGRGRGEGRGGAPEEDDGVRGGSRCRDVVVDGVVDVDVVVDVERVNEEGVHV